MRIHRRVVGSLKDLLPELPRALQEELTRRISVLVAEEVSGERHRCIELCRYRGQLWEKTLAAGDPAAPPMAREEARARSNEAKFLADLIESEEEFHPPADA